MNNRTLNKILRLKHEKKLIRAVVDNSINNIKELTSQGVDVNCSEGIAVILACQHGYLEALKILHKHGADLHFDDQYPLQVAAEGNNLSITQYLIQQGANLKDQQSKALIKATEIGHLDIVKQLVNNGANPNGKDGEILLAASTSGSPALIEFLMNKGANPFRIPPEQKSSFISLLNYKDHSEFIDYLISTPILNESDKALLIETKNSPDALPIHN